MVLKNFFLAIFLSAFFAFASEGEVTPSAFLLTIDGAITAPAAEYLSNGIREAADKDFDFVVITMDTPGGLDSAMRQIIKTIMEDRIPVVVYVSPKGSRAASAGTFITLSAHLAAMAPGTTIGAAHPVGIGPGGEQDETMTAKVTNDAVAYIQSLARRRGRNLEWAEAAVRESAAVGAEEALSLGAIDLMAEDLPSLLEAIDGRTVDLGDQTVTLRTAGITLKTKPMTWRHRLLDALANPTIAYLLLMAGLYGLFFEFSNPGLIFPGVVGGICLILGFYALQTLPVNYAGLLLILLGIVLFILEIKITSYGLLSVGGVVSLLFGSLLLFRNAAPYLRVGLGIIVPVVAATAVFFLFLVGTGLRAQRRRPQTGAEGLIGEVGEAKTSLGPDRLGKVFIHGELWKASCPVAVNAGQEVEVVSVREPGLVLQVKPFIRRVS